MHKNELLTEKTKIRLLKEGWLVPLEKESEYGQKHGVLVHRLDNGCVIFGVGRQVSDSRGTYVSFQVNSGSFFDPVGKKGLHHFVEHLYFNNEMNNFLSARRVKRNGLTYANKTIYYASGVFNPRMRGYGLWNCLPVLYGSLETPVGLASDEYIEATRSVINKEIFEVQNDLDWVHNRAFNDSIFNADHPYNALHLGTKESLATINKSDFFSLLEQKYISQNMIVSVLSDGQGNEYKILMDHLGTMMESYPRQGKRNFWDASLLTRNRELKKGQLSTIHVEPFFNGMVTIKLMWSMPLLQYSLDDRAITLIIGLCSQNFHAKIRSAGLSYSCELNRYNIADISHTDFSLVVPKDKAEESIIKLENVVMELVSVWMNDVLGDVQHYFNDEKVRQKAQPILQEDKFDFCLDMLKEFGLLVNHDRLREISALATKNNLNGWLHYMQTVPPARFIIGHLK